MQRPRERNKVRTLAGSRPRSPRTRGTWALEVGSIKRARTICSKARSPPTASPSPRRVYAPCRTSHNRAERLEATTAPTLAGPEGAGCGAGGVGGRSSVPWPRQAAIFCRPASSPVSVLADPRCSTIRRTPPDLETICTARGPRSGPDLTHKRAHTRAPYGLLVPHLQTPKDRNTNENSHQTTHNPPRCYESGLATAPEMRVEELVGGEA